MMVIPSIDLLDGEVVRLRKGDRAQKTVYAENPQALVRSYCEAGAKRIHIVDLNGAFSEPRQETLIADIVKESRVPVQVGGGIRSPEALQSVFAAGARFAVLGTAAIADPTFVERACREHPGRVIVAVDAKDGRVAIAGWSNASHALPADIGKQARVWGAAALLYTDIERDGTEVGPAVDSTLALEREAGLPVIASGGIGRLDDIYALARSGVSATVVGRALYEKRFSLAQALEAAC
jgi:phosphoribosylformimino-5-aminoimidazole carboxamide ribotide isomerase